ncbi:MAG: hypothetical protein JHD02_01925 [Thermoleophilaceae bacterium]|nr:hypothetical protein [Thermoleophilaceae bacterium]
MPRKNTRRTDRVGTVSHGYNREVNGAPMFRDDEDRRFFKSLFARYLSTEPSKDSRGRVYPNFRGQVELLGLAIKTTHYHVTPFELELGGAGELMRTVVSTYVRYFNRKYGKAGAMFDGEVRLRPASNRREALNAIAYVHENHGDHCYCEFCSHSLYVGHPGHVPDWVNVERGLALFGGVPNYLDWLRARQIQRKVLGRPEPW